MSTLTPVLRERALEAVRPLQLGRVAELLSLHLLVTGLPAAVGDLVEVAGPQPVLAEVAASGPAGLVCLPLSATSGLRVGDTVRHTGGPLRIRVGDSLQGRVLDGLGRPVDGGPSLDGLDEVTVEHRAPDALSRPRIDHQVGLGVRAMDALTPCGRGQRLGIMAGSGVGKSSLLSMIARGTDAEVSRDRPGRRAWPRGPRVHRERPRSRGSGQVRRRRRDLRRSARSSGCAPRSWPPGSPSRSATPASTSS